jgi:hypothetical protein
VQWQYTLSVGEPSSFQVDVPQKQDAENEVGAGVGVVVVLEVCIWWWLVVVVVVVRLGTIAPH